ncbi:MAG: RHS repeat-associated core domain protein, partial [Parcubacteria group bacterium Gr01-1014_70]
MSAGQTATVSVTMKNCRPTGDCSGLTTWTTGGTNPYRLGSQNPQDNTTWGLQRVNVPTTVSPGQSATFTFTITAPSTPGTYNFQWRMVQELIAWFGDFTPNVAISVVNVPSTKFVIGDRVDTTANLNVRATPSTSGTLLGTQLLVSHGVVVGGPTFADGYWWWNINYDTGVDGWSIENYLVKSAAPFSFTLSNGGAVSVVQGSSVTNTLTATYSSG